MASVELSGETFQLRSKVPPFITMSFARATRDSTDASQMDQLAAMLDLLQGALRKDEWPRFVKMASDIEEEDDLLVVVNAVFEALADRPTGQPSESSDGLTNTESKSPLPRVASVTSLPEQTPVRPDVVLAARRSGLISA